MTAQRWPTRAEDAGAPAPPDPSAPGPGLGDNAGGLEQLWAGWRHGYVASATEAERRGDEDSCVFCRIASEGEPDPRNGIVWRGAKTFVVLNAFPYASGHVLVLPVRHVEGLGDLDGAESAELWEAVRRSARVIQKAYRPDGMNIGANLGRAAGAGIPKHLHLHVVPRWSGDTNFMTSVGGIRVLPEYLADAWEKLHAAWPKDAEAEAG